jgi:predicted N-acetyltransferase YhbS
MSHCASSSHDQAENFPVVQAGLQLASGTAADHHAVFNLLQSVFQAPTAGDFQTQLEEPFYEPNQRLVVRHGVRVVSHVRLCHREMRFGPLVLPVSFVTELATAAPYRQRGLATALLTEAERQMTDDGTVIGFVRTDVPEFFVRRGWTTRPSACRSSARASGATWNARRSNVSMPPTFSTVLGRSIARTNTGAG